MLRRRGCGFIDSRSRVRHVAGTARRGPPAVTEAGCLAGSGRSRSPPTARRATREAPRHAARRCRRDGCAQVRGPRRADLQRRGDLVPRSARPDAPPRQRPASALAAPGDRVAILSQNRPEFVDAYFGVPMAGMGLTFLNYRLAPRELSRIIADAEASVLLVEDAYAEVIAGIRDELTSVQDGRRHRRCRPGRRRRHRTTTSCSRRRPTTSRPSRSASTTSPG